MSSSAASHLFNSSESEETIFVSSTQQSKIGKSCENANYSANGCDVKTGDDELADDHDGKPENCEHCQENVNQDPSYQRKCAEEKRIRYKSNRNMFNSHFPGRFPTFGDQGTLTAQFAGFKCIQCSNKPQRPFRVVVGLAISLAIEALTIPMIVAVLPIFLVTDPNGSFSHGRFRGPPDSFGLGGRSGCRTGECVNTNGLQRPCDSY